MSLQVLVVPAVLAGCPPAPGPGMPVVVGIEAASASMPLPYDPRGPSFVVDLGDGRGPLVVAASDVTPEDAGGGWSLPASAVPLGVAGGAELLLRPLRTEVLVAAARASADQLDIVTRWTYSDVKPLGTPAWHRLGAAGAQDWAVLLSVEASTGDDGTLVVGHDGGGLADLDQDGTGDAFTTTCLLPVVGEPCRDGSVEWHVLDPSLGQAVLAPSLRGSGEPGVDDPPGYGSYQGIGDVTGDGYEEIWSSNCLFDTTSGLRDLARGEARLCIEVAELDAGGWVGRNYPAPTTTLAPPQGSDIVYVYPTWCEGTKGSESDWASMTEYNDCGTVFGFASGTTGTLVAEEDCDWRIDGTKWNGKLGASLAWAGDQDGDGALDLLVGEPGYPDHSTWPVADNSPGLGDFPGSAFLFLGPLSGDYVPDTDADVEFRGPQRGSRLGEWVGAVDGGAGGPPDLWMWSVPRGVLYGFEGGGNWLP